MDELIYAFISTSLLVIIQFYMISILMSEKIKYTYQNILKILLTVILLTLNYMFVSSIIRMIIVIIVLTVSSSSIFKKTLYETTSTAVITQLICMISEILSLLFTPLLLQVKMETISQNSFTGVFVNIIIAIINIYLINSSRLQKTCKNIISKGEKIDYNQLTMIIIIFIITVNLLLFITYYKVNFFILLITSSLTISFVAFAVYKIIEEQNLNAQYKFENDALINNLHEYEKMVDEHRVINHENKNQLGIIRTMVETKDETVLEYIDDLVKNNTTKDESLLSKTSRIPAGGLQGIIYQKLLTMKKEHINYALNISRDIKFLDFKKLDMGTMVEICKIIGVFLDNAIEEVENLEKTYIGIELYVEDDAFCIKVSNNYSRGRDFSKIEELGYTTKENGHGYGLFLVKEIIEKNDRLINERSVTGKYFNQIVKVLDMCEG
jgi:two-component system sensor histidine kinase AgrC